LKFGSASPRGRGKNAYVFLPRVMEVVNPHRVRTGTGLVKQK